MEEQQLNMLVLGFLIGYVACMATIWFVKLLDYLEKR